MFDNNFPTYLIPSYFVFQWDNIKAPEIKNLIVKDVAGLIQKFKKEKTDLQKLFQGMPTYIKPQRKLRYTIPANKPPQFIPHFDTSEDAEMGIKRTPILRRRTILSPGYTPISGVFEESKDSETPLTQERPTQEFMSPKRLKPSHLFAGGPINMKSVDTIFLKPPATPVWTPGAFSINDLYSSYSMEDMEKATQPASQYSIVVDGILPTPEPKRSKVDQGDNLFVPNEIIGSGMYTLKRPFAAVEEYRKRVARMPELERYFATAGLVDRHKAEKDIIEAVYKARESMNPHFIDMALNAAKQVRKFAGDEFGMMVADQIPAIKAQKKFVENVRKHNAAIADVVSEKTGVSVPHVADLIQQYAPYENPVVELLD